MAVRKIEELAASIDRHARQEGLHETAIRSLALVRRSEPSEWSPALYEPAIFLIAQGTKEIRVADVTYQYDPARYVIASVDMPVVCRVSRASARVPYLSLKVKIDPLVVGELLASGAEPEPVGSTERGFAVTPVEPPLLDAVSRLVALLDAPSDVPVLAPLLLREVTYRALSGPQGARLRQMVAAGAPAQRVARAISWIKDHAAEPLRMDALARRAGMGLSAFHLHFKTVTGLSPLQFQKRLRLLEARRLMVAAGLTAAEAAFRVGYESPSQFSREYRRAFGAPPRQDVVTLKTSVQGAPV
ncbi:MAG TPA: AraC family transcriptional regulator [Planctomycetota bacterium]|nr:AraC family transcriptional regulator [Planctomycetota bacterium]